jgi:hypothetical protein
METSSTDSLMHHRATIWIAVATGLLLLVPLVAMQFTDEVAWAPGDFVLAGTLLFGTGLIFLLAATTLRNYRTVIGIALAAALIYVSAELAVGVVTTLGS